MLKRMSWVLIKFGIYAENEEKFLVLTKSWMTILNCRMDTKPKHKLGKTNEITTTKVLGVSDVYSTEITFRQKIK